MTDVLVVDDSLTVRMDLEEAFASAGFAPALCADLGAARRALAQRRFDLAVLDVLLPDGDGLDLLAEIRASPHHARTPVILLSSEAEVRHRIHGLRTGADEYVGKPYDAAYVVARARELVRRGQVAAAPAERGPPLVLVVDDSLTAREALRADLGEAGIEAVTAASAEEGLRIAAVRRPDAVVVDGMMEGMDGAAFVRQLRADPALRATPCILLTAGGAVGELGALDAGADAWVQKEEGSVVVVARLHALLRGARASRSDAAALLAPQRLVLLGDEAPLRDIVARLRQDGHDLVAAASADEALALLGLGRVDGLLVLAGGGLDAALEATRRVKSRREGRDVPLLVVGEADEPERVVAATSAGADDYVAASAGPEVVRARLRALVRRAELEREARERDAYARSASILESISDAFFAVDRSWRLVYVNRSGEAVLGAARAALLGTRLWDRSPWLAGAPADALRRAAADLAPVTFEVAAPGERWLEVRAFPHQGGLSAYLRDVTDRRRSEEIQSHVLGIVGHDLRTPLTAIAASAGMLLRDDALSEKSRRAAQRVSGSAHRMTRLISDLLDYSRARQGQPVPIRAEPAHFDAICREVLEEVQATMPDRNVVYRHEGDGLGAWDRGRVQQVLVNLLVNALRHGAADGPVTLAWTGTDDEKVITVHNHGPAIPEWLRVHLFEPFKRGDDAGNAWGGVGLGLYIVRQIVLAHSGEVTVRSEDPEGTTFTVRLPSRAPLSAARTPS